MSGFVILLAATEEGFVWKSCTRGEIRIALIPMLGEKITF